MPCNARYLPNKRYMSILCESFQWAEKTTFDSAAAGISFKKFPREIPPKCVGEEGESRPWWAARRKQDRIPSEEKGKKLLTFTPILLPPFSPPIASDIIRTTHCLRTVGPIGGPHTLPRLVGSKFDSICQIAPPFSAPPTYLPPP